MTIHWVNPGEPTSSTANNNVHIKNSSALCLVGPEKRSVLRVAATWSNTH